MLETGSGGEKHISRSLCSSLRIHTQRGHYVVEACSPESPWFLGELEDAGDEQQDRSLEQPLVAAGPRLAEHVHGNGAEVYYAALQEQKEKKKNTDG
jgi:hypothetical protein